MRKTKKQKRPKSTDALLKTSRKKDIELKELPEGDLNKVTGGLQVQKHFDKATPK